MVGDYPVIKIFLQWLSRKPIIGDLSQHRAHTTKYEDLCM